MFLAPMSFPDPTALVDAICSNLKRLPSIVYPFCRRHSVQAFIRLAQADRKGVPWSTTLGHRKSTHFPEGGSVGIKAYKSNQWDEQVEHLISC